MLSVVGSVVAIGLLSSYGSFPFVISDGVIELTFGPAPFWFAYKLGYFVLLGYVFVVPYCAYVLLPLLYSFLDFIPAAVNCFSISNKFMLLAFTPNVLLLY